MPHSSLIVAANRLPITWDGAAGRWVASPGGLVRALGPAAYGRGATWVGWPGTATGPLPPSVDGIRVVGLPLSKLEIDRYYDTVANSCLWPAYHDAIRPPVIDHDAWRTYRTVNRRFADRIAAEAAPGATVWVQDYHLQLVPGMLRRRRPDLRIGFFLHTPFPSMSVFARLPWRSEILDGLRGADLLGFQTSLDLERFRDAAAQLLGDDWAHRQGGSTWTGVYPASIDVAEFERLAARPDVLARAAALHSEVAPGRCLYLGVDRLDYTKAIDRRLEAFDRLLTAEPGLARRATLLQIAVPTREGVESYRSERARVEALVADINHRHAGDGPPVVHYVNGQIDTEELVACYRAADVMLVTPWKDGMNLVAKEYVAAQVDHRGVLVLSEFAGAAAELGDALLVNPHDIRGFTAGLRQAWHMGANRARHRMAGLRAAVRRWDAARWAATFLEDLEVTAGRVARPAHAA